MAMRFTETTGGLVWRPRRHRGWVIAIIATLLLPWLFLQQVSSNAHWRETDESVTTTMTEGQLLSKSDEQRLIRWWPDILSATRQTGVPPVLIATIMLHESHGLPQAAFHVADPLSGAYGLMQLEPSTAQHLPGYYPGARQNPSENILLGAELLQEDSQQYFGGNWLLAIAAYYGGPGTVQAQGVDGNVSWPQAAPALNIVPCPPGKSYARCYRNNAGTTMTMYVNTIVQNMKTVSTWQKQLGLPQHMPTLFPHLLPLPSGISADSLLGEVVEIVETAGDMAAA